MFYLHCIYCGKKIEVTHILFENEPLEIQKKRLEFEDLHDSTCGPKSVGMISEIEDE